MKIGFLLVCFYFFIGQMYSQRGPFINKEITSSHEKISSKGVYLIPPQGFQKSISSIGYYNDNSEMVFTLLSKEKLNLEINNMSEFKDEMFKLNNAVCYYFESKKKFESVFYCDFNKSCFKMELKAKTSEEFKKLKDALFSIYLSKDNE